MSDVASTTVAEPTVVIETLPKTSSAPAPTPPAPAPVSKEEPKPGDPAWLGPRLERERNTLLKSLGVESLEQAKKAVEALKAVEDAQKSEAEKRAAAESALQAEQTKSKQAYEALGVLAKSQMDALSDAQRAAVTALAGDDPAKQITSIAALKPTWAGAAAATATATETTKTADTAHGRTAPKDGANESPPDHKAIHASLLESNPIAAARYALEHRIFDLK